jgi:hypothetical protein
LTPETLQAAVAARVDDDARRWLEAVGDRVAADPAALEAAFPAVSRRVGRHPLAALEDPGDPFAWTVDDAARALLLAVVDRGRLPSALTAAYRHGDPRERRGVLRALDVLDPTADEAVTVAARAVVDDALRTNDTRLIAAALGPGGVALLDDDAFAQAVLKCLFVGLDVTRIPGLADRVTPTLSRMAADYVHERIAAGRDVPATAWLIVDAHPPADRLGAIAAELEHPDPARAAAARTALAQRG